MAISNATRLADFGSGIGTDGAVIQVDNTNKRVGIGTTNPQAMLQVGTAVSIYGNSGIVSAVSFYGDGSNITGLANTDIINAEQINVIGVVTATTGSYSGTVTAGSFSGDGSALTGISGFATALSSSAGFLNEVFKTPKTTSIAAGTSVTLASDEASGYTAFTRAAVIHVGTGSTLHISNAGSGTTFITNVLNVF